MATASARRYGRAFDEVADEYERRRPTYPDELVAHACRIAGLASGDRVLEVGCGSGQLTRSLIDRGLRVTALDPGERLLALAAQNLERTEGLDLISASFEDAHLPVGRYRAVLSASAFHWIDPEVSWRKAAAVLAPGGTLALVQYCGVQQPDTVGDQEALLSALASIAPEIAAAWPSYRDLATTVAGVHERRENVSEAWAWIAGHELGCADAGRLFCDVQVAAVPVRVEHTADELNALLGTLSFYRRLTPDQREALQAENDAIYERLGRPIRSSTAAVLVTARLRNEV